jgi:hypothetical protein
MSGNIGLPFVPYGGLLNRGGKPAKFAIVIKMAEFW